MVLLDVENWLQADAIDEESLRTLLKQHGGRVIKLKKGFEAHRNQYNTIPPAEYIGPYIGIQTREGHLAVVHIEDFSGPKEVHYRLRTRAP
jgi:hypothetical protein